MPHVAALLVWVLVIGVPGKAQESLLVETEAFQDYGGWKLDTQFVEVMGSPYLLAHGLGRPVEDAVTHVDVPRAGAWHVWVRTMDWVARWGAKGAPGRFQLCIGPDWRREFGGEGADWQWHSGGPIELPAGRVELRLRDLTGFDGRCDAIWLTQSAEARPPEGEGLWPWRCKEAGLPVEPEVAPARDLVVVGGGYAGMAAAIAAARMGCSVALIQNRPVLGGNGSSEVRVWSQGDTRRGRFPRIGEIVEEFRDFARHSPGVYEDFGDAHKEAVVRAEPNLTLYLNHHVYAVERRGDRLVSVDAFDTATGRRMRFPAKLFSDCTGHGTVGFLAAADWEMTPRGRLGMSNMWRWEQGEEPFAFSAKPWALSMTLADFPYPREGQGKWFWESGFDLDPIRQAEAIRDWNLRAVYSAFHTMKHGARAAEHQNARLTWIAYIGGTRESRRLLGDVQLTQEDIVTKRDFVDGCVPSTWTIDLHYPKSPYDKKFPDNPFISEARHDRRVDRNFGYPVPYRCFYSRNIDNLFMAGRCISVTHEALGTVRVMRTCGMMGEVVGKAASVCIEQDVLPRAVYERHWENLAELLRLPGGARRDTIGGEWTISTAIPNVAPLTGLDPTKLEGLVVDDADAVLRGAWGKSFGLEPHVAHGYRYSNDAKASASFPVAVQKNGSYEVRYFVAPHENRSPKAKVVIDNGTTPVEREIDLRADPGEQPYVVLGTFRFRLDRPGSVTLTNRGGGFLHADAIQLVAQR
ncbi:MAG: FAD-dependent oxidoreductase [Planctomycetota bacterium]|nr:FAD-dependent oxidoreductase [Planctomycetota bacterium]